MFVESNERQFWLVWNERGHPPPFRHGDRDAAEAEAQRLARAWPGQKFYVLCAIEYFRSHEPVERTVLDDGLPF